MNWWSIYIICIIISASGCKDGKPSYNEVVKSSQAQEDLAAIATKTPSPEVVQDNEDISGQELPKKDELESKNSDKIAEAVKKEIVKPKPKKVDRRGIMKFDSYVHEFGEIKQGDVITHEFYFTNTGKSPINVKSCTATCGCTIPSYPFLPIGPGERGYVGVTYNSTGKYGQQTPVVTVISDAKEKVVKLKLTGNVQEELQVENATTEDIDTSGSSD